MNLKIAFALCEILSRSFLCLILLLESLPLLSVFFILLFPSLKKLLLHLKMCLDLVYVKVNLLIGIYLLMLLFLSLRDVIILKQSSESSSTRLLLLLLLPLVLSLLLPDYL